MPQQFFFIQTQPSPHEGPHAQEVSMEEFEAYCQAKCDAEEAVCITREVDPDGTEFYFFREDMLEELNSIMDEIDGFLALAELDETRAPCN